MIRGLEKFKRRFAPYKDQYVLIGGAACELLMDAAGRDFRATKDLDLVLLAENITPDFGRAFWAFIREGRYRHKSKSSGEAQFYRFDRPEADGFPHMIELFSRSPWLPEAEGASLTPIRFSEDLSSLSAILLNKAYYELLREGRTEIDGVMILGLPYIILFKAKAWLELNAAKEQGRPVDSRDIKKHKNDIARLAALLTPGTELTLSGEIKKDMEDFIARYEKEPAVLEDLGMKDITNAALTALLKAVYLT